VNFHGIFNSTLLLAAVLLFSPFASVAGEGGDNPAMSPEIQAEMEAWMKLAQPGAHHEHLAAFVGSWKGEVKMWMTPDGPPMVNESTAEAKWILGGRFLEWIHTGDFGGMPFEGRAIEGYNNGDKRYESIWLDNFGTLMMLFTGSCSNEGMSRTMSSSFNDVVAGRVVGYRTVYDWIDEDRFTYTAFMDKGEGEHRNVVITWQRQ
jgi:hypothetical protein